MFGSSGKTSNPMGTVGTLVGAIGAAFSVILWIYQFNPDSSIARARTRPDHERRADGRPARHAGARVRADRGDHGHRGGLGGRGDDSTVASILLGVVALSYRAQRAAPGGAVRAEPGRLVLGHPRVGARVPRLRSSLPITDALDLATCPPRSGRRGARATGARPAARACSRGRRGSAPPGRARGPPSREQHELHGARLRVELLAVERRRAPPASTTRYSMRLRGHDLGRHVGEHELDRLELRDRRARTARARRRTPSDSSSARVDAPTVRAPIISRSSTNQSFVSSKPCPTSPSTRSSPTRTSSNAKIGCSNTNVCMYLGVRTSRTPGVSLSTRKTVAFAGSPSTCACTRKKSATSPRRHVPLLAVEHPAVAVAPGGRRDHASGRSPAPSSVIA